MLRLVRLEREGAVWLALDDGRSVLGTPATEWPGGIAAILAAGRDGFDRFAAACRTPLPPPFRLLCPLERPEKILAVGLNYSRHAQTAGVAADAPPTWFLKPGTTLADPDGMLVVPDYDNSLDPEGELAVIMGRGGRNLGLDAVGGYAVANDFTLRRLARPETLLFAKGFDGALPLGPGITPAWAVPDPQALTITSSVNGVARQHGSTADMRLNIAALIAQVSAVMTLSAGDVLLTGAPASLPVPEGHPPYLKPGDVVRVGIAPLGVIETRIAVARGERS